MRIKETIRIIGFNLIVIVAITLFTGCESTLQTYSGPAPQGNAILKIKASPYLKATSLDGERIKKSYDYVRLLPGKHTISFAYRYSIQSYSYISGSVHYYGIHSTSDIYKDIYVEAGIKYIATAYLDSNSLLKNPAIFA
ncbi:MAG: hypothetical protein ACLP2Y_13560 [Limisphaerales bacterium]